MVMKGFALKRTVSFRLSVIGFCIILATAILEYLSPQGVYLSWGYIVGLFLTMASRRKMLIITAAVLGVILILLPFFYIKENEPLITVILDRTYSCIGLGITGLLIFRIVNQEVKSEYVKTQMAGIFSHGTQGIILFTAKEKEIVMVNPFSEKIFGYANDELLGSSIERLIPDISSPILMLFQNDVTKWAGEDLIAQKKDKLTIPIEVSLSKYESAGASYVIAFITDITIRKQNAEALSTKKKELEAANHELEAFSYSVSHDLRAPLRAVSGYATMIREDYHNVLDDEGQRLLHAIQQSAKNMGTLIDNLLSFSRLGKKEVRKTVINMSAEAEIIHIEINKNMPNKARVVIHPLHTVLADPVLIKHVLSNLLSNAIKYSSKVESPLVELMSTEKDGMVTYQIRDNGAGFDMNYAQKLFGVFQRLHSIQEFDGTGVGLAIAQRIIQKHGGKIWAEGKVDAGASFYFSLPAMSVNSSIQSHHSAILEVA